ncbi:15-hydroxyprostaglandin dehydrogenase [Exophiala viscosa]|uniref:15-hydroxyprostaglandin dehydrogenase n=1 Tax=Exophiala viscosa TaxID=2486360 RepID=A0AAN6IEN7_9EURO|nr:15-hydroxyprostaglandin dehydrogenase [Exophiala viscosa]
MSKVALITGGASGLGLATSRAFAKDGWTVAIADLNVTSGEQVAKELGGTFYKTNVTDWDSLSDTFARVWKEYERLDFVFANAGIVEKVDIYKHEESDARGLPPKLDTTVMDINLTSVINTSYLAIHFFRKNTTPGGALVITASSGGLYPVPFLPMYGAAKHGCVGFTRSIANTMSKEGIRVNCICPGAVRTGLLAQHEWDRLPQATFVPIEKVVKAVQMLVNDDSLNGKAVELIKDQWKFRDPPEFEDEAMKEVMSVDSKAFDTQRH